MTTIKDGDNYYIIVNGDAKIMLTKNYLGTHGHSKGWQTYKHIDGRWIWAGVDSRVTGYHISDPPIFSSIKAAREYYSALG